MKVMNILLTRAHRLSDDHKVCVIIMARKGGREVNTNFNKL